MEVIYFGVIDLYFQIQLFLKKFHSLKMGSCVSHTRLPDTSVSDLGIISDTRILFDAYQYDTDEMQIIKFHDLTVYLINFNIILILNDLKKQI
jgi:hypothetical protein